MIDYHDKNIDKLTNAMIDINYNLTKPKTSFLGPLFACCGKITGLCSGVSGVCCGKSKKTDYKKMDYYTATTTTHYPFPNWDVMTMTRQQSIAVEWDEKNLCCCFSWL